MNLFILVFILLFLLVVAYLLNDSDAIAPSVLFCVGFFVCAIFAVSNASAWDYQASDRVVISIALGIALFVVVASFIHVLMRRHSASETTANGWILPISKVALVVFLVLQVTVLFWTLRAISQMYPADNPLASISLYDQANKFTEEGAASFPFPLGPLRGLCTVIGYYVCYLLGQSFALRKHGKYKLLLIVNLVMAMLVSFEGGGRTTAISLVIYSFIAYLLIRRQWLHTRVSIPFKAFVIIFVSFVTIIAVFQVSLVFMGRSSQTSYWNYICMYVGAEIPNLDSYLTQAHSSPHLFGYMTFYTSINLLGNNLGISEFIYQLDLPFKNMNGILMGNVYTTFYAFIYDFGALGIATMVPLMAMVSQWIYEKAIRFNWGKNSCIWVILYCLVANTLIMSFFSNKFFEAFFCIGFVRQLIFLVAVHAFYRLMAKDIGAGKRDARQEHVPTRG